ncbi:dnaJ homolog subfamily B member 2-like [Dermacentor albipictus]|uniref:dnaJ homolog subfamily B member 2-like n=1 Tax=Dermacentor albipictus TaxID=60249 RepID=UPI0031FD9725
MAQGQDYYSLLGVSRNATTSDISKAYKALALQWHPDKYEGSKEKAERMFRLISEAHNVLSNDSSRQRYDNHLRKTTIQAIPPTPSGTVRAYCYIVPSYSRQSPVPQQSCSYTQQSPVATYPQYSMTTMYRPTPQLQQPVVHYNMFQPSTSQYSYTIPLASYLPKQAMSMTGYVPTSSTTTPYHQTPPITTNVSLLRVPSDYERQTSTRIVRGTRMDLEVIKENAAEIVNVYENGVLTQSTYRRTRPPS